MGGSTAKTKTKMTPIMASRFAITPPWEYGMYRLDPLSLLNG